MYLSKNVKQVMMIDTAKFNGQQQLVTRIYPDYQRYPRSKTLTTRFGTIGRFFL